MKAKMQVRGVQQYTAAYLVPWSWSYRALCRHCKWTRVAPWESAMRLARAHSVLGC